MKPIEILLVEDERVLSNAMCQLLRAHGHVVRRALHVEEALKEIRGMEVGLVILDLALPAADGDMPRIENGMRLFEHVRSTEGAMLKVIVLTGEGKAQEAVECIRRGAEDFVVKPIDPVTFPIIVERAMEKLSLEVNQAFLKRKLTELESEYSPERLFPELLGKSRAMKTVFKGILYSSEIDENVLITGETGTGKNLVAEAIHRNSSRKDQRFVTVNCGGIPGSLFEAELFGSERGAFTGAVRKRQGLFEHAGRGTVFLDEVGEIPLELQPKLLHAVERRQIRRVGGNEEIGFDARIISATNTNLERKAAEGAFRKDLLYRLKVFTVHMPALRDRGDDVILLARHFLNKHARRKGKALLAFSPEVEQALLAHDWPGNVRELENSVIRAVISAGAGDQVLTQINIGAATAPNAAIPLPAGATPSRKPAPREDPLLVRIRDQDSAAYARALLETRGNKARAARLLGIPENTFRDRVRKLLGI